MAKELSDKTVGMFSRIHRQPPGIVRSLQKIETLTGRDVILFYHIFGLDKKTADSLLSVFQATRKEYRRPLHHALDDAYLEVLDKPVLKRMLPIMQSIAEAGHSPSGFVSSAGNMLKHRYDDEGTENLDRLSGLLIATAKAGHDPDPLFRDLTMWRSIEKPRVFALLKPYLMEKAKAGTDPDAVLKNLSDAMHPTDISEDSITDFLRY